VSSPRDNSEKKRQKRANRGKGGGNGGGYVREKAIALRPLTW